VDKTFNGTPWFKMREQYLKREPMRDREEAYAAIRKLLATLDDPFTRFLEPARYAALRRGTSGSVTGVGLEVAFSQADATLGKLVVRLVAVPAWLKLCQAILVHGSIHLSGCRSSPRRRTAQQTE
jgi:carboxyl-terminal processing protease